MQRTLDWAGSVWLSLNSLIVFQKLKCVFSFTLKKGVISQEKAAEFIKANVPSHKIFHVEGDRLCTLRSFLMGIRSTFETDLTLDDIISTFRKKCSENAHICQPFSSDDDLCNVFERFLENPLGKYNENTTDLFLHALCNSYNENIIVIKSDRNSSWIEDITPNAGGENKTLNFVKTLSEHIDPILSCAPQTMGENNASTNTNDDSDLEIIRFIQKMVHQLIMKILMMILMYKLLNSFRVQLDQQIPAAKQQDIFQLK